MGGVQPKRKHDWKWSTERRRFRCSKCHSTAFCTTRLRACLPRPIPPEGISPYIPDRLHTSHVMWAVCKEDKDPMWYCNRCGAYSFKRCKKLSEPCKGSLKEHTAVTLAVNINPLKSLHI